MTRPHLTELLAHFATVPDQRQRRGVRYPLAVLLTTAVLAKLCGASQVHALADWARERAPELATIFGLARPQMPHPTTWTRVFGSGVAVAAIETALQPLLMPVCGDVPRRASEHHALDGKTLRGTIPAGTSRGVHLLSRYDLTRAMVRHHMVVGAKANEVTCAPHLVRASDVTGVLLTGDAMFTQRELSAHIVEAGGD
jgi:hypothetical protein